MLMIVFSGLGFVLESDDDDDDEHVMIMGLGGKIMDLGKRVIGILGFL